MIHFGELFHNTINNNMSTPTVNSIASDKMLDRAMGHGGVASGGRGVRKYEVQMTRRDQERLAAVRKQEAATEATLVLAAKKKLLDTQRAMEAGELDYM